MTTRRFCNDGKLNVFNEVASSGVEVLFDDRKLTNLSLRDSTEYHFSESRF